MEKQRSLSEKINKFFEPILNNKKISIELILHNAIYSLTGVIFVLFLKSIFFIFEEGNIGELNNTLIIFGIIFIVQQSLYFSFRAKGWTIIVNDISKFIYKKYLSQFTKLDNNAYESLGTGKSVAIISKGVKTWGMMSEGILMNGTTSLVSFIFVFFMIGGISYILLFIFIVLLILGMILALYLNKFVVKYRNERYIYDNNATNKLVKIIMSKYEILQSGKIDSEIDKLNIEHDGKSLANIKMSAPLAGFFMIPDILVFGILFGFIAYFGGLYFQGELSLSMVTGAGGALILIQKEFLSVMRMLKDITKEFSDIQKFWDFFDNTPEIQGYETGEKFIHDKGNIQIKNLNYGYVEGKNIFTNFSLDIEGEKITALVGNSGSGKSTLVKLIAGYIRADGGDIIIDNQKLNDISLKTYYKDIGYLTQEPSVFDGTILDNLTYAIETGQVQDLQLQENPGRGEPCVHPNHLDKIIKMSKCEFIYDLPNGLDTEIGERGVKLSGGQRQRLAIAKIMLKDPKIIILDEPTSALDSFSEQQITQAMNNLFKNRTVIVIAHRLQTVKHADKILVLENGKISEEGNHDTLVNKGGIYAQMLELQSGF